MIKTFKKYLTFLVLSIVIFFVFIFGFKTPNQNKNWALDQSVLSEILFWDDHQGFSINNIRDWEYQSLNIIKSKKKLMRLIIIII